jgi:hypothetical protein
MNKKTHPIIDRIEEEPVTYQAVEDAQLYDSAFKATPAQRLAWLEEMLQLAHKAGALEKTRNLKLSDDD